MASLQTSLDNWFVRNLIPLKTAMRVIIGVVWGIDGALKFQPGVAEAARREEARIPIIILGNKSDLQEGRRVTDGQALDFCKPLGLTYLPTSAKTGLNVEEAFKTLSMEILKTFALPGLGPDTDP